MDMDLHRECNITLGDKLLMVALVAPTDRVKRRVEDNRACLLQNFAGKLR